MCLEHFYWPTLEQNLTQSLSYKKKMLTSSCNWLGIVQKREKEWLCGRWWWWLLGRAAQHHVRVLDCTSPAWGDAKIKIQSTACTACLWFIMKWEPSWARDSHIPIGWRWLRAWGAPQGKATWHGSDRLDVERTGKPKGVKQGAPRCGVAVLSRGRKDAEGGGSGPSAGTARGGSHVREEVGLFSSNPTPTSGGPTAHDPEGSEAQPRPRSWGAAPQLRPPWIWGHMCAAFLGFQNQERLLGPEVRLYMSKCTLYLSNSMSKGITVQGPQCLR